MDEAYTDDDDLANYIDDDLEDDTDDDTSDDNDTDDDAIYDWREDHYNIQVPTGTAREPVKYTGSWLLLT